MMDGPPSEVLGQNRIFKYAESALLSLLWQNIKQSSWLILTMDVMGPLILIQIRFKTEKIFEFEIE